MAEQDQARRPSSESRARGPEGRDAESPRRSRKKSRAVVVRQAREQFEEMTGLVPESISAFKSLEDGWQLNIEVVEVARFPDTTSILATYSVQLDADSELVGYERLSRYSRGQLG